MDPVDPDSDPDPQHCPKDCLKIPAKYEPIGTSTLLKIPLQTTNKTNKNAQEKTQILWSSFTIIISVLRIRIRIRIRQIPMFLGLLDPDLSITKQN